MTEQKKKHIDAELEDIRYELEGDLRSARDVIDRLISTHGEKARIDIGIIDEYGSTYAYAVVRGERLETDAEFAARLRREEQVKQMQEARDQAEYDRLLKKYGPMVK